MSDATAAAAAPRPARRVALLVVAPVAVVLAAFIALLATGDAAGGRQAKSPLVGKPAPAIAGTTTANQAISLDSLRGSWVVVNFFASWCVPCVQEHPELIKFADRHEPDAATILSVAYADSPTEARRFFTERGGDWPVLADKTTEFAVTYGVVAAPETYVIAPSGVVVAKFTGRITADGLDQVIAKFGGASR